MEERFYRCNHCGNIVGFIRNSGVPIVCCGEKMAPMPLNDLSASGEKHIPVVSRDGDEIVVTIGEVAHPMLEGHYIDWIYLETVKGGQRKKCIDAPSARFSLSSDDMAVAAYAYCNLHGLWRTLV